MENLNSKDYLDKIRAQVIENLSRTKFAPSVQLTDVPRDPDGFNEEDGVLDDMEEDGEGADRRYTQKRWDQRIEREGELSDSEDEGMNGSRRQNGVKRRRNERNYRETGAQSGSASGVGTPVITTTTAEASTTTKTATTKHEPADDMDIEVDEDDLPCSNLRGPPDTKLGEKVPPAAAADDEDVDMGDVVENVTSKDPLANKGEVKDSIRTQAMEVDETMAEVEKEGRSANIKTEAAEPSPLKAHKGEAEKPGDTTEKSL